MKKIEFARSDLDYILPKDLKINANDVVSRINLLLEVKIEEMAATVYCSMPPGHPGMEYAVWTEDTCLRRLSPKTHSGILINIEEIAK